MGVLYDADFTTRPSMVHLTHDLLRQAPDNANVIRHPFFALALSPVLVVLAACTDAPAPVARGDVPATTDEVYQRLEQAIDADGNVLHVSYIVDDVDPPQDPSFDPSDVTDELWIYARDGAARSLRGARDTDSNQRKQLVRSEVTYGVSDDEIRSGGSLTCRGSESPLLAKLMRCVNFLEKSTTVVEGGEYDGRFAIVLVTSGELPDEDGSTPFTTKLFIDPTSYLPIASDERRSYSEAGKSLDTRIQAHQDIEVVDRSALPADFFEPEAIGYVEPDPTAHLAPMVDGMQVYWLGKRLTLAGSGIEIALESGYATGTFRVPPGISAVLDYRLASRPSGPPVVSMQEFSIEAWSKLSPSTFDAGSTREELMYTGGHATLIHVPASYERYRALVYFDSAVILLLDYDDPSVRLSRESFIALIEALQPYK